MKRKSKKVVDISRNDWKDSAENEIIILQENIDELADELGLSEAAILGIEKLIDKFKIALNEQIDGGRVIGKMALYQAKNGFIYLALGTGIAKLEKEQIESLNIDVYSILDIDIDDYTKAYKLPF